MVKNRQINGPDSARCTFLFAHGAGAGMATPFMETISSGLAQAGIRVVRFEFPYMLERRQSGKKRPPDRQPVLLESFCEQIQALKADGCRQLVIGGKSMGGRMATLLADEMTVSGVVCLGYPFHPPGKPEKLRVEHLEALHTPTLICQGERDTMGNRDEVSEYSLSPEIRLHWLADGDHSFKPRKRSGHSEAENLQEAISAVTQFLNGLP